MRLRHRLSRSRRTRPEPRFPAAVLSGRMRLLWAAIIIVSLLVLPVGRGAGYRVADALCAGYGCGQATGEVPQCATFGRDRASAAEATAFMRSAIDRPDLHLQGAGDGSVEISTAPKAVGASQPRGRQAVGERLLPGGRQAPADAVLTYRFGDLAEARHWLLDHTDSTGRAVDAAAGPMTVGSYRGYLRAATAAGFLSEAGRTPHAISRPVRLPAFAHQPTALSEELSSGARTQTIVPDFPLPEAPALTSAAHRLGITAAVVVEIFSSKAGELQRLRISGWGTAGWSLAALRAPDSAKVNVPSEAARQPLLWRSYSLDLRRSTNARAFAAVTEEHLTGSGKAYSLKGGTGLSGKPYAALVKRLRADAVFVESQLHAAGPSASQAPQPAQLQPQSLRAGYLHEPGAPVTAVDTAEVRSADLSLAGSEPADLLSCEVPDDTTAAGAGPAREVER